MDTKMQSLSEPRDDVADSGSVSRFAPRCLSPDPLSVIEEEHALQMELCDVLETIADDLPDRADREMARVAVSILNRGWPAHIALEEKCLFPLLRLRSAGDELAKGILERLESEHQHDEDFAGEIAMALQVFVDEGVIENAAMLGYMLRGFFESQRRHLAWENATILPAARRLLQKEDLIEIQAWIMAGDHPRCTRQSRLAVAQARNVYDLCGACKSSYHLDH